MKNLMNTLLVTLMLLFTFISNSQTTFGETTDPQFEDSQIDVYDENEYSTINYGLEQGGEGVFIYGNIYQNDSLTFTSPNNFRDLNLIEINFLTNYDFEIRVMYSIDGDDFVGTFDQSNLDPSLYTFDPQTTNTLSNIVISFVYKNDQMSVVSHDIKYITFNGDIDGNVSLNKNNLEESFKVYSYDNLINIQTSEFKDYTLQVYNTVGKLVMESTTNGNFENTLSESGVYIVKLQFENEVLTKKIFIK